MAVGPNGDLFVSDNGNNRVLEYPSGAGSGAAAVRVFGQPGMTTAVRPTQVSAQTLAAPQGIAVDPASNLYVADAGANRVLIFPNTQSAPVAGMAAAFVIGQASFGTNAAGSLKSPADVAVDSSGTIYVADYGNNRVLIYPSLVFLPLSGGTPTGVVGQQTIDAESRRTTIRRTGWRRPKVCMRRWEFMWTGRTRCMWATRATTGWRNFLKAAAVVNAATYQASVPVAQGSLATLFGGGLASDTVTISATTWPKTAANRQLVVNDDLQAPIYYIGPKQVNFQVPSNARAGVGANRDSHGGYRGAGGGRRVAGVRGGAGHLHREPVGERAGGRAQSGFHGQFVLEPGAGRIDRFDLRHGPGAGESGGDRTGRRREVRRFPIRWPYRLRAERRA